MTAKGRWGQKRASAGDGRNRAGKKGRGEEGKREGQLRPFPAPAMVAGGAPPSPPGTLWQPLYICRATEEE